MILARVVIWIVAIGSAIKAVYLWRTPVEARNIEAYSAGFLFFAGALRRGIARGFVPMAILTFGSALLVTVPFAILNILSCVMIFGGFASLFSIALINRPHSLIPTYLRHERGAIFRRKTDGAT